LFKNIGPPCVSLPGEALLIGFEGVARPACALGDRREAYATLRGRYLANGVAKSSISILLVFLGGRANSQGTNERPRDRLDAFAYAEDAASIEWNADADWLRMERCEFPIPPIRTALRFSSCPTVVIT
jgi:hypothetical protein